MADEVESASGDGVVETLKIEIVGESDKAERSLDSLIAKLDALNQKVNGFPGSKKLESLEKTVSGIDSEGIQKLNSLANAMGAIKNAGRNLISKTTVDRLGDLTAAADLMKDADFSKLDELARGLAALHTVGTGIPRFQGNVNAPADTPVLDGDGSPAPDVSGYEQVEETLREASREAEDFGRKMESALSADEVINTTSRLDILRGRLKNVTDEMDKLLRGGTARDDSKILRMVEQAQRLKEAIGEAEKKTEDLGKKASETEGKFSKLETMFKRRVLYRGINAVISLITNGFKEGIENVYQYSKALNGLFASSMDQLATERLYIHNGLGAAASALITATTPLLLTLGDLLVDVSNSFNQFFAAMSGAKTWTKAVKYPTEYAKAMGDAVDANKDFKASVLGFDQLNILNGAEDIASGAGSGLDYSKMFEEVSMSESSPLLQKTGELLGWIVNTALPAIATFINDNKGILLGTLVGAGIGKIVKKVKNFGKNAKVPELFQSFLTGFSDVRESGGSVFEALKGGIDGFRNNLSATAKWMLGAGGFFMGLESGREIVKKLGDESDLTAGDIASIGLKAAGAATLLYTAFGPAGLAVAGISVLVGAIGEVIAEEKRAEQARQEWMDKMTDEQIYRTAGVNIDTVRESLKSYLDAMDFDRMDEWRQAIENLSTAYQDAKRDWENMWTSISQRDKLTDEDVVDLSASFERLAGAAQAVSDQKIEGLMERINSNITKYLSDEVQTRIEGLTGKLRTLQHLVGQEYTGLTAQFNELMVQAQENGMTPALQKQIEAIVDKMDQLTMTSTSSEGVRWEEMQKRLKDEGVAAGQNGDKDSVQAAIDELIKERDAYMDQIRESYYEQRAQLEDMIELDQTYFGGMAGLKKSDLDDLELQYQESLQHVMEQYNSVLKGIFSGIPKQMNFQEFVKSRMAGMDSLTQAYLENWLNAFTYGEKNEQSWKDYLKKNGNWGFYSSGDEVWEEVTGYYQDYLDEYQEFLDLLNNATGSDLYSEERIKELMENVEEQMDVLRRKYEQTHQSWNVDNHFASGGYPETGEMFIAREAGPELVGRIGRRTAVANNDQIVDGVAQGVAEANAEQNSLIREGLALLARLADKEFSATAYISTSDAVSAFDRMNRRAGKQLVRQDI